MEKVIRNFAIIILVLALGFSCKSKKKLVEKEETAIEVASNTKTVDSLSITKQIDSIVNSSSENIKVEENQEIELKQADENKTITIEDESGKKLTIKGADAIIRSKKVEETQKDTLSAVKNSEEILDQVKGTESSLEVAKTSNKTTRKVDKKSFLGSWWILGLVAIVILGVRWYLKKNPITRWF